MIVGMTNGSTAFWRHGMMTEIGGKDCLELLKFLYCKLRPPGCRPEADHFKKANLVPLLCFHHSVGIAVGLPVVLHFSEVRHFQEFGFMMLGMPLCLF